MARRCKDARSRTAPSAHSPRRRVSGAGVDSRRTAPGGSLGVRARRPPLHFPPLPTPPAAGGSRPGPHSACRCALTASLPESLRFVAPCRPHGQVRGLPRPAGSGARWLKGGVTEERKRLPHLHGRQLGPPPDQGAATWPALSARGKKSAGPTAVRGWARLHCFERPGRRVQQGEDRACRGAEQRERAGTPGVMRPTGAERPEGRRADSRVPGGLGNGLRFPKPRKERLGPCPKCEAKRRQKGGACLPEGWEDRRPGALRADTPRPPAACAQRRPIKAARVSGTGSSLERQSPPASPLLSLSGLGWGCFGELLGCKRNVLVATGQGVPGACAFRGLQGKPKQALGSPSRVPQEDRPPAGRFSAQQPGQEKRAASPEGPERSVGPTNDLRSCPPAFRRASGVRSLGPPGQPRSGLRSPHRPSACAGSAQAPRFCCAF